jgi:hypothetical protein
MCLLICGDKLFHYLNINNSMVKNLFFKLIGGERVQIVTLAPWVDG